MSEFEFDQGFRPWDMALSRLSRGMTMPAGRFLALMEQDSGVDAELAALELEQMGVALDVTGLPKVSGSGKTGQRVALEAKLYRAGTLNENLEENDPLLLTLQQLSGAEPAENEQLLAERAAGGDEKAAGELTNGCLPKVYDIAGEFLEMGVLLVDLIQEGSLGLWQAVLNYQSGEFSAQADWWIRQAMARAVVLQAHANGVGTHMAQAMERYRKADRALLTRLGRNPLEEEIAAEMGVTAEEAAAIGKMLREVEAMERVKGANAPKEPDPEEEQAVEDTAYFQSRQRINEMLSGLNEQEAKILSLRFGLDGKLPMTAAEVGKRMGLTADEVTEKEAAALGALRRDG